MWEFVQLDEDDTSSIVVVLLDPRTIDTIKRAKTKALSIIKLSIKDQIVPYILNIKNPKACWDVLKRRFEISNNTRRLVVHHKFSNLHMEEGSSVANFMCTIQDIVNQLSQFGGLLDESIIVNQLSQFGELHDESIIVEHIVNALPSSFDSLSRIISSKRDIPTLEEIAMHLELQESKNTNHNRHHDEEALVLKFWKVLQQRHKGPHGGFNRKVGNNHAGSFEGLGNSSLKLGYCGRCGKYGHWAKECPNIKER